MHPFHYTRANDLDDAVAVLARDPQAALLAGVTGLIDLMKLNVLRPTRLIAIRHLPLDRVEPLEDSGLRIRDLSLAAERFFPRARADETALLP